MYIFELALYRTVETICTVDVGKVMRGPDQIRGLGLPGGGSGRMGGEGGGMRRDRDQQTNTAFDRAQLSMDQKIRKIFI